MTGLAQTHGRSLRWRIVLWSGIAALLLLPLAAMQLTREVNWTAYDFAVAAGLLIGAGLAFEVVARTVTRPIWRLVIVAAILLAVVLIWAQGAVGII